MLDAFNHFFSMFLMREKKNLPPNHDPEIAKMNLIRFSSDMMKLEGIGKLFKRCEDYKNKYVQPPQPEIEIQKQLFSELYPAPKQL